MTLTSSTISSTDMRSKLDLVEIKPGTRFSVATLRDLLPDVETCLFFGKVYELNAQQLANLLRLVLQTELAEVLFGESHCHSHDLQGYLDGEYDEFGDWHPGVAQAVPGYAEGEISYDPDVPHGEILPQVWEQLEVEVARSIKDVAAKLESTINLLPGKAGSMVFSQMAKLNKQRPVIGDYRPSIQHARQKENLVILDVSGSMTDSTIRTIINDVIALSYNANAHLAIVSNTCTYWQPGTYDSDTVLRACEFAGTHYEQLVPLFDRDWGTVITIADYDSYVDARSYIARCTGRIDEVLDISLVNKPTFLAECVGQIAGDVRPILIASSQYVLA